MKDNSTHNSTWKPYRNLLLGILAIFLFIFLSGQINLRWDLTAEKRFTLTPASVQLLRNLPESVHITVYLEGKNLPAGIKLVRDHTRELLQDMRKVSKGKLSFDFVDINAIKNAQEKETLQKELVRKGVLPVNLEVNSENGYSEKLIYPGAIIQMGKKELGLTILENQTLFGAQEALANSLNFLEYKVVNTIDKLEQNHVPTVAFLQGQGEVTVAQVGDFLESLSKQNFQIKKIEIGKDRLLDGNTDVLIIAKPTQTFSEDDKFAIDQYVMRGGKVLWLVDEAIADMDSFRIASSIFSIPRDLNLDDLLFRYGARIHDDLVLDLYCAPVPIVEQIAGNPVPKLYPWVFYPIVRGDQKNLIVKNLDPVLMKFPSSIDTLRVKGIRKTILLSSSAYARKQKIPFEIFLEGARQRPRPDLFNQKDIPMAVLLEGKFPSHYAHRAVQSQRDLMAKEGVPILNEAQDSSKMIIVGDGDVIVNETDPNGNTLPLGYYRIDQKTYANKEFLINAVEYLIDHGGLMQARNRDISMRILDKSKIQDQKGLWQFITVGLPIPLIFLLGWFFNYRRKKKYAGK